jgi:transcriptional regulator with XRE-family HTH domain
MDQVRLGLSLRALRRRRGWTQQQLADRARVSRSAVQRIERGDVDSFTGRLVRTIATVLGHASRHDSSGRARRSTGSSTPTMPRS